MGRRSSRPRKVIDARDGGGLLDGRGGRIGWRRDGERKEMVGGNLTDQSPDLLPTRDLDCLIGKVVRRFRGC